MMFISINISDILNEEGILKIRDWPIDLAFEAPGNLFIM